MNILIIGPSWVGDMMMSQSLYKTLKHQNPSAKIDVMAPAWCKPLLNLMPEVNNGIEMPIGHGKLALKARYNLGKSLKNNRYDKAIILPISLKSALIPFFADIPVRTGWRGEFRYGLLNDMRVLDKAAFPRMVDRYLALAYPKNQMQEAKDIPDLALNPSLKVNPIDANITATKFNLDADSNFIAICPCAEFGKIKRWPEHHYAALINELISLNYKIILFGSKNDVPVGEQIALAVNDTKNCINLIGKTSLAQAINLMSLCVCTIANDSGLMHLSAALNKPTAAIYGPTDPAFAPPLTSHKAIISTNHHYKIKRGKLANEYDEHLLKLAPKMVLDHVLSLIKK